MPFEMALIQMSVGGGDKDRNLARAEARIAEAAAHGSRLVLLPEALDLGWSHPSSQSGAEPIPTEAPCRRLAHAASAHGVYVCAGLTERAGERVFNSAVLLDDRGEVRAVHRKVNELAIGHPYYAQGDQLRVVQTDLGALGMMLCADAFARHHVLSRALGSRGGPHPVALCVGGPARPRQRPGAVRRDLAEGLRTRREGIPPVDCRGEQRGGHGRGALGRATVHRLFPGRRPQRRASPARPLRGRRRDDSVRGRAPQDAPGPGGWGEYWKMESGNPGVPPTS